MLYKNKKETVEKRVQDLIERMTLEEKVAQLCAILPHMLLDGDEISEDKLSHFLKDGLGRIPQFPMPFIKSAEQVAEAFNKVQKYAVEETRLGIPIMAQVECLNGVTSVDATSFPAPIAMASTWEPELVEKAGKITGQQMRAMTNGSNALAPVVDLARDPRWGRVYETYGECSYMNSAFGVAYTKGLQNGDFSKGVQSCAKHFLGYSFTQGGLNSAEISIGERELYEAFARPFEAMIHEADLRSVMCTYSEINGKPVSVSSEILRDLLRDKMGFEGSAICDGGSIERTCATQHTARDMKEAGVMALMAGLDADAPVTQAFNLLPEAVKEGEIDEKYIDEACARVLKQKFDLGLFDNPYVDISVLRKHFDNPADDALSLEICEKSITMLKNEDNILPLSKDTKKIAIIGPHGDSVASLFAGYTFPATLESIVASAQGTGGFSMEGVNEGIEEAGGFSGLMKAAGFSEELKSDNFVENYCRKKYFVKSIVDEISDKLNNGEVLYSRGCNIDDTDTSGFEEAVRVASEADVIVMTIGGKCGWTNATSGEGQDRTSIDLPGVQEALLKAVKEAGKPIILVLFNGRPMSINWASENIEGILDVWFTGPQGGKAIANVLFGDTNPSGKLPVSVPRSSGQIPIYYNHKNGSGYIRDTGGTVSVDALFGGGYTDIPSTPLYYFGFGLSYTTFEYLNIELDKQKVDSKDKVQVTCYVKNTGDVAGDEVVQVYFRDKEARVTRPVKELVGFRRISLEPGQTKKVTFTINMNQLGFYNENMEFIVEPGNIEVMVGSSSSDIYFTETFEITGEKVNVAGNRSYISKSNEVIVTETI